MDPLHQPPLPNYHHESCICMRYLYHVASGTAASVFRVCEGIRVQYVSPVSGDDAEFILI